MQTTSEWACPEYLGWSNKQVIRWKQLMIIGNNCIQKASLKIKLNIGRHKRSNSKVGGRETIFIIWFSLHCLKELTILHSRVNWESVSAIQRASSRRCFHPTYTNACQSLQFCTWKGVSLFPPPSPQVGQKVAKILLAHKIIGCKLWSKKSWLGVTNNQASCLNDKMHESMELTATRCGGGAT